MQAGRRKSKKPFRGFYYDKRGLIYKRKSKTPSFTYCPSAVETKDLNIPILASRILYNIEILVK